MGRAYMHGQYMHGEYVRVHACSTCTFMGSTYVHGQYVHAWAVRAGGRVPEFH